MTNKIARHTFNELNVPGDIEDDGYPTPPIGPMVWFFVGLILSLNRLASMSYS